VVDASTGDAWLYGSLPRVSGQPLLVCRSHGLEHVAHDRLLEEVRRGAQRLSWKYPLYHGGLRLLEVRRSIRHSDLALVLNGQDYGYAVKRLAVPEEKIRLVQNGIPENFLGQTLRPTDPATLGIAQIGRYSAMKGVAYGSKALNNILQRHRHVRVHFLGTMVPPETVLRDFHPDVRERIAVTPRFVHENLPRLLAPCQIKFFPTLTEGFGVVLVEAMACGLAPVTTTAPGPRMIVLHEHNGLLVAPGDPAALEKAVNRLILDPVLLDRLRCRALADAQTYSWRTVAQRQIALFEEFRANARARSTKVLG
jgi:glycosyltransferase involved in cell wall biosynthesis